MSNTKLECKACGKPEKRDRRGNSNMVLHLGVCVDCAHTDVEQEFMASETLAELVERVLSNYA